MKLIVGMNVFNEALHIKKAIESVVEYADEVRVYDGAYKDYPHDKPYSTDGTIKLVKELALKYSNIKLVEVTEPWNNQIEKRTAMFDELQEGDYFLKLDGDEYISNPEEIRKNLDLDIGWCWTFSNIYPNPYMTARIFRYQKGLHYAGRHHWLYNGDNVFITSDQRMNLRFNHKDTPIRLFNFRDSSTVKRMAQKKQFLLNRNPLEQQYGREDEVYGKPCERLVLHPRRASEPQRKATIIREVDKPIYSFTGMISRPWAVGRYLETVKQLKLPDNIEAVIVVDTSINSTKRRIYEYFESDKRFVGVKIIYTDNPKLPENSQVCLRRQRIIGNWHLILTEIRGDIILSSEDDSLPEKDAYMKLLDTLEKERADFVQGNIIGRWGARICPAWKIIEKDGKPIFAYNEEEKERGLTEIQGVGWYCFVAPADIVRKYAMIVDDYLPLGPDVRFGYELSRNGYKLFHRWDVKVEHFGQDFSYYPGEVKTEQRMWYKSKENEPWKTSKWDIALKNKICNNIKI